MVGSFSQIFKGDNTRSLIYLSLVVVCVYYQSYVFLS